MKTIFSLLLTVTLFGFLAFTGPVETLEVDAGASQLTWKGYKVTGSHEGTIGVKDGKLLMQDGKLIGGNFTIDVTTIKCTDLNGGGAAKLEGHLKSDDFFGVENHPTASFEITKIAPRGTDGAYKIYGDLTIKGTTKEIRFNTQLSQKGEASVVAMADLEIDRTDFDLRYGSGSFFDGLGDRTIYDEFELSIELVAAK